WAGPKCDDQIDECESNPCQNGAVCIDVHADYMCACTFGFTGKSCEVQIEFCDDSACSDNALCVVEAGARVCYCVPDYHGERCELQYDECLLGPRCLNGGTCIDGVDNFTCSCPPKLTGPLCDCLILDDGTYDCEYIAPRPTQSVLTTIIFENTTTDVITTFIANDTIARTSVTSVTDQETPNGDTIITTELIETTTEMTTTVESNTETVVTDIATSKVVTEEITKVTIESDNAQKETTTEISTITSPLITEGTTTEITMKEVTELVNTITSTEESITAIDTTMNEVTAEVTSTPSGDSTDKMFTDTPTEHSTDLVTPPTFTTTEVMEVTTETQTGTHGYTTVQSECTDSYCNNHGTCLNSPHGIRITISSAAFGGNSFIAHKLQNTTSIDIAFNAKTLLSDGQIMHVDIATGVYMQLYMNSGLLKFKFSCGYQTMLLSELKTLDLYPNEHHCNATLRLNDTVAMSGGQIANVSTLDHNTTLYLGNSPDLKDAEIKPFIGCIKTCLSGPCLNGGTCTDRDGNYTCSCANGWTGARCNRSVCEHNPCQTGGSCVRHPGSGFLCLCPYGKHGIFCEYSKRVHPYQSGGSCVRHPGSGFLCLCPYGKHGIFCEYKYNRASRAGAVCGILAVASCVSVRTGNTASSVNTCESTTVPVGRELCAASWQWLPVSLSVRETRHLFAGVSSYLLYPLSAGAVSSDRFDLRLRFQTADMEQIALLAFVGQNGRHDARRPRRIFTSRALSARRGGHSVRVWRRGRAAGLTVDGRHNVTGNAPALGDDARITLTPYLYIGGHPSESFRDLPHDLPLHSGWRGCVWEVGGQTVGAGRVVGGRGVGQCGVQQCAYAMKAGSGQRVPTRRTRATSACPSVAGSASSPPARTRNLLPTDVLFSGTRSYIELFSRTVSSVSLSLEAEIKPTKERGLVIFAETPHFYTALSMQGGLLEYRWTGRYGSRLYVWVDSALSTEAMLAHAYPHTSSNATILLEHVTSLVRSGVVLSMSQWHRVKAGRYGSRLYVWVDSALSTEAMLAHAGSAKVPEPRVLSRLVPAAGFLADGEWHTLVLRMEKHNISVLVDRAPAYVEEPGLHAATEYDDLQLYIGCIDHISTSEQSYVTDYSEFYSENVKSCQLFPPT
ncbi:Crumbs, partial [Operophtera brumata]